MNETELAVDDFFSRYRIEPRSGYHSVSNTWLVVFDKKTGTYLMDGIKYRVFRNSDEIFEFLKTL